MEAFGRRKINLETVRHGGQRVPTGWEGAVVSRNPESGRREVFGSRPFETRQEAVAHAREQYSMLDELPLSLSEQREGKAMVRRLHGGEYGELKFPGMLIPGGKNATEVPIRLGRTQANVDDLHELDLLYAKDDMGDMKAYGKDHLRMIELEKKVQEGNVRFHDQKGHFGDDVLAWVIHDQRKMPDGKTATFIQELQSDWHQTGAKTGYGDGPPARLEGMHAVPSKSGLDSRYHFDVLDASGNKIGTYKAMNEQTALDMARRNITKTESPVPNAPFRGNEWTKLGIKQAIADAIARGDDYVMIASPELVSRTQGMPIAKARKMYGEIVPNLVNEMLKPHGVKLERMRLPGVSLSEKTAASISQRIESLEQQVNDLSYKLNHGGQISHHEYKARSQPLLDEITQLRDKLDTGSQGTIGFRIPDAMKTQAKTRGFPMMSVAPWAAGAATGGALYNALRGRQFEQQAA
jgi:hypothetical protein